MSDITTSFVFSVVCVATTGDCRKLDSEDRLDRFKSRIPSILEDPDLRDSERLDSDQLILKNLDVYAGVPLPSQEVFELPIQGINRYGRPMFVGIAEGKNIFTKNIAELSTLERQVAHRTMRVWQVKFNYLLHEIFSWDKDGALPYVIEYAAIGRKLEDFHPQNFKPDAVPPQPLFDPHNHTTEHPWVAAWTIFVVQKGGEPVIPYVMSGSGGC